MVRSGMIMLTACLLATGCGDDNNPTAPSRLPLVFSAVLLPGNEVPLVPSTSPEAGSRGAVQVTFDVTRGAGDAITAATATFHVQLIDIPADTRLVGAHIHEGPAGVAAPIILGTPLGINTPVTRVTNNAQLYEVTVPVPNVAFVQRLVNNPAAFYFNVHSALHPGGLIRGQLERVQ